MDLAGTSLCSSEEVPVRTSPHGPCFAGPLHWARQPWTSWQSPCKDLARPIFHSKKGHFCFPAGIQVLSHSWNIFTQVLMSRRAQSRKIILLDYRISAQLRLRRLGDSNSFECCFSRFIKSAKTWSRHLLYIFMVSVTLEHTTNLFFLNTKFSLW